MTIQQTTSETSEVGHPDRDRFLRYWPRRRFQDMAQANASALTLANFLGAVVR
jgi:hypothetical protein